MAREIAEYRREVERLQASRADLERKVDEEVTKAKEAAERRDHFLSQAKEAERELVSIQSSSIRSASRIEAAEDTLAELERKIAAKQEKLRVLELKDPLVGLTTEPDPTFKFIRYLTTEDRYLGRLHLGKPLEVEAGTPATGEVRFYPFRNEDLRARLGGSSQKLRLELLSQIPGTPPTTPLGSLALSRLLLHGDDFPILWQLETPKSLKEGKIFVQAQIEGPGRQLPDVSAGFPALRAEIPLTGIPWWKARIDELGLAFSALTGLVGVVGGFVLGVLRLFSKARSTLGGGG
jgi:hypothetical protein